MNLSLSCDHRVVDGWDAASFMQDAEGLYREPAAAAAQLERVCYLSGAAAAEAEKVQLAIFQASPARVMTNVMLLGSAILMPFWTNL